MNFVLNFQNIFSLQIGLRIKIWPKISKCARHVCSKRTGKSCVRFSLFATLKKIGSRMFDTRKTSFTRNTDLTRKTSSDMAVLVTGSNKGIGFQILRTLARQKYRDFQGKVKFLQNLSFFSIFSEIFILVT